MFSNCIDAQSAFEKCWENPAYTQIELDDVDVNHTLSYYLSDKPVHFNKEMLWDMETKKAWNPGRYISYVVREGSSDSWDKHRCPVTGGDIFVRCSEQRRWLNPDSYEKVYEEVYVDEKKQRITFIGTKTSRGRSGELTSSQPLFHVEHSVGGSDNRPLNKWRIVHLTEAKDERLIKCFKAFNDPTVLPGFIRMYIEKDLGQLLQHK